LGRDPKKQDTIFCMNVMDKHVNGNTDTFLILGGTGFIGSNLVRYLVEDRRCNVKVFCRKNSDLTNLKGISFVSVEGGLVKNEYLEVSLKKAMEGCQGVFNLAACTSPLRNHGHLREAVNVNGAKTVAKVARSVGVRLVHISSSTALGIPKKNEIVDENHIFNVYFDDYGLTKYKGERNVVEEVEQGLDAVIAIPCSTIGARGMKDHQLDVIRSIAKGRMRVYPPGGLCLTSVDDLIRGIVRCYEKGDKGRRYILGGHNITYKKYFDEIASATNGKSPWIRLPATTMPWLGLGVEIVYSLFGKETNITRNVAKMICKNLYYSSELAIKDLGYSITDLTETIIKTIRRLQKEKRI